jgi:hypothetical protein
MRARRRRLLGLALALGSAAALPLGCADFDTSRVVPKRRSLGYELFGLVCDRVGAQALREDVTGASFRAVCHPNAGGAYADEVDVAALAPIEPSFDKDGRPVTVERQKQNRERRVARIEALARNRDRLAEAFDHAFADVKIPVKNLAAADPARSCEPPPRSGEADLHGELRDTLGRLVALYNDQTIPEVTRGVGKVLDHIEGDPEAQQALARLDARQGYRPMPIATGVARPALSYPRIVDLANAILGLVAPRGKARAPFEALLDASRSELRGSVASPPLGPLTSTVDPSDPSRKILARPRGSLELARTILLAQNDAFQTGAPKLVVQRDARGVAVVPLVAGQVPAPFVDADGDKEPDLDPLGRFVTTTPVPAPFFAVGTLEAPRDPFGRVQPYAYIDASKTFLASLARDFVPMLDPDPARGRETIMYALGGLEPLFGTRDGDATSVKRFPDGGELRYKGFHSDDSALVDLVYAIGQLLADPTTDDTLLLLAKIAVEKPKTLARLVGVGLEIKRIADRHPEAKIPRDSTLWDEMLDVAAKMAQSPKLVEDIVRAFGKDDTLALAPAAAAHMSMRDELTYDRANLNGPVFNLATSRVQTMVTPVDRARPDTGANRSAFQRFLAALHDTLDVATCTKQGAVAHIVWNGLSIDFPSFAAQAACVVLGAPPPPNPMPLCGMFRVANVSENLVDAVLGRVQLDIRDACLRALVASPLTGIVGGADAFLEDVSGIKGFSTHPTVQGINRLTYFDTAHDGLPGDTQNAKTNRFLRDLFDPAPTNVCAPAPFVDTDGKSLNLRQCRTFAESVRGRANNALFPLEEFGFIKATGPLAQAFSDAKEPHLFVDLFDALAVHWGSDKQSAEECTKTGTRKTNARWCAQDGAVSYEPLLVEVMKTDLFPALHDGVRELEQIKIKHCDARDAKTHACTKTTEIDGVTALAEAVKALVDPKRAAGLKDRKGMQAAVRNDGTSNPQTTPIYLLVDALKRFDDVLASWDETHPSDARQTRWKSARSHFVDTFFATTGTGAQTDFANPAFIKVLPTLVGALREQVAAHCPDPAASACVWARQELTQKLADVVKGPTFAAAMDLVLAIRADDVARPELERLLQFLLQSTEADADRATLTAAVDLLQTFEDDANLTPLLHVLGEGFGAPARDPEGKVTHRSLADALVETLSRVLGRTYDEQGREICAKEIDPNRTLAVVLRQLVTPMGDGRPAPVEVIIDVLAEVNRYDPRALGKLEAGDYKNIALEVSDFCLSSSRGLEQVYEVIRQATQ